MREPTPHPPGRRDPRGRLPASPALRAVAAALLLGLAPVRADAQADRPALATDVLTSPTSTADQRAAAAMEILQATPAPAAASDAIRLLTDDPTGGEAARAVLTALSRLPQAPNAALAPTTAIARDASSPLQVDAIRALRSFRGRDAAAILVELVSDGQPPAAREAAFRSLARLSGRDDLGTDPVAWRDWLAQSRGASERQWEQELLAAHIRRSQRLETSLADGERRLVEAWRQIHLLTPIHERSAVLTRLLLSDQPPLRELGFELVNREISESRVLDAPVARAAIDLLQNPDALVRAQAALVLNRLVPPEADTAVLAALARETDPRAADALLLAASRWPGPSAVRPTLRWMESTTPLRLRAAGMAWALLRSGNLDSPEDRAAVIRGLRPIETSSLTPAAVRLLVAIGEQEDLARVQRLVEPEIDPLLRASAAEALGLREDEVAFLLHAALTDPVLFEPTARAAKTHLHDARGYAALAQLPAPSPEVRSRVLADYAAVLSTEELVRLAKLASSPGEALPLLNPLISPERSGADTDASLLAEGLLMLARTQLELGAPTDALNALALIPDEQTPAGPAELIDLRATLLLWLNRLDEAEDLNASAAAWLDALERAVTEPHAGLIAERIEEVFGGSLSEEDRMRLERLRREVADADAAPLEGDG